MSISRSRCNNNAQFFHNLKWIPFHATCRIEPHRHECLGWSVHVFHLRVFVRVRVRELRGAKEAPPQRRVQAGGESRHAGQYTGTYPVTFCY